MDRFTQSQEFVTRRKARSEPTLHQRLDEIYAVRSYHKVDRPGRVAIVGLFETVCGLQRGAELMYNKMRASGSDVRAISVSRLLGANINHKPDFEYTNLTHDHEIDAESLVIHLNPPNFGKVLSALSRDTLMNSKIVGYWAWELNKIPDSWVRDASYADELWAPSPFVAKTLIADLPSFNGVIKTVAHPVDSQPFAKISAEAKRTIRENHSLAADLFIIGYSFSFGSNYARKNPIGAIDAFRISFPEDPDVRLILRVADGAHHQKFWDHFKDYASRDERVIIAEVGSGSHLPLTDFYALIDVYLSMHRSEGYGLQLIEAAQSGARVVTTGWELAPEIAARPEVSSVSYQLVKTLDYSEQAYANFEDAIWADPDLLEAAKILRSLKMSAAVAPQIFSSTAIAAVASQIKQELDEMTTMLRKIESNAGQRKVIYLGEQIALTHLSNGMKIFVDTADVGISTHLMWEGNWESWIGRQILPMLKPGMTVCDIGANFGYYTLSFANQMQRQGKIYAFEANPHIHRLLEKSVSVNGLSDIVRTYNVALYKEKAQLKFGFQRAYSGGGSVHVNNSSATTQIIDVQAEKIDDVLFSSEPVNFIKMDVEGAEALVIEGGQRIFSSSSLLAFSMEFTPGGLRLHKDPRELVDRFLALGFSAFFIEPEGLVDVASGAEAMEKLKGDMGDLLFRR
ncbi:FkbM family methyltransferase [Methylobacterium mesophilicum]